MFNFDVKMLDSLHSLAPSGYAESYNQAEKRLPAFCLNTTLNFERTFN
jgi:hypothetical protein